MTFLSKEEDFQSVFSLDYSNSSDYKIAKRFLAKDLEKFDYRNLRIFADDENKTIIFGESFFYIQTIFKGGKSIGKVIPEGHGIDVFEGKNKSKYGKIVPNFESYLKYREDVTLF